MFMPPTFQIKLLTLNLLFVSVCVDKYTHILMYQLELILVALKLKTQFQNNQETFLETHVFRFIICLHATIFFHCQQN